MATQAKGSIPATLMVALDQQASRHPDRLAFVFLHDGEVESGRLTFSELRERSLAVAARLTEREAAGDRAILLYPPGLEFIVAFFGCLYAGVIAVPTSTPNRKRGIENVRRVAADSGARWLLSTGGLLRQLAEEVPGDGSLAFLTYFDPELGPPAASGWAPPAVDPSGLAILQYTSGSTGSPSGVAVTHANLVDNHQQMQRSFAHDEATVIVSWLPMFHDMGLGTVLMAVWAGRPCVLMAPGVFVQKPRRWLAAISRYRGTTSLAPDFAYHLCVQRLGPEERQGLDLSSWRVALNGSEPVRGTTLDRFVEAFAPCGFRREAFHPAYGLAEATLFVTSGEPDALPVMRRFSTERLEQGWGEPVEGSERGQLLVSCGHCWMGTSLDIVHPETLQPCQPGEVGEIWIGGASVAAGYWQKPVETEQTFRARTALGEGPYLRTGDLGFVDRGHLFVTGRCKDLIIIRGRNHSPQDIEGSVSTCHPALVPYGCAAFSIDSDQGEQLVIVQEVARTALRTLDAAAVGRAIRAAVSVHHGLQTHAVLLLKPSSLPRTTSGKVRRKTCRQAFLDKSMPSLAAWIATTAPDPDADRESERLARTMRADRLINWLRRHAADFISSYASEERRTVPASVLRDFGKHGLLGLQVDPEYGGLGLGHADTARVLEQLAAVDFGLALFVGLNNYLGIQPLAKHAGPQIKALLLPGLTHGQELSAFALEEPGGGTAMAGLAVKATADGEERWRLFGTKYLDGIAQGASVISVFAQHEEPPGISAFVVSAGSEGLRQLGDGLLVGVLGFTRDAVALDGVKVGRENLLGALGSGVEIAREAMMHTRLAIASACMGGMKRCAQVAGRDGKYGAILGKLTPNPVTLSRLGTVTARVAALECLVHRIARAVDAGQDVPSEAFAACKILGPELLLRSIDDLTQLGVNRGYAETNRISSLYRDAGLLRNFDGPPEAMAELTGAQVMDEQASLRLLVEEVFDAPDVVPWIDLALDVVRQRMTQLSGALLRRAERWGHTRAGELVAWLALLAAVDGARRAAPSAELERAHAWAEAQLEYALTCVRSGTPSEAAALDTSDIAATFATYAHAIGDLDLDKAFDAGISGAGEKRAPIAGVRFVASPAIEQGSRTWSMRRELRSWIIGWLTRRLQIPVAQIDGGRSFADHGLDSVASVELAKALSDKLGRQLDPTLLWNVPTIDALADHLVVPATDGQASPPLVEKPASSASASRAVESQLADEIARLERELKSRG